MKIFGIGNALLDVLLVLESDDSLKEIGIEKGAMDLISESQMEEIQQLKSKLQYTAVPGGSVCNTINALSKLGAEVGYIGKIGRDDTGGLYEAETIRSGVKPFFVHAEGRTGCSTVLISPDSERTMATYLGLAETLSDDEISDSALREYDCIYIEGYLISNEKLFQPILKRAKALGLTIALDLSNFNIVNEFKDLLKQAIPEYVDILFSNESEAEAYTGLDAAEAVKTIAKEVEVSVVTVGKKGVFAGSGEKIIHEPALDSNVVDTTGAGDNFAAGFLYGYANRQSLEKSARIGTLLSTNVIETIGARIEAERWEQIKLKVNEVLAK